VLRAEGEAEGAKLIANAMSEFGPGLLAMRKIETAQFIVEQLNQNPNVSFLPGNALNMINVGGTR
jgi:hypothetical protein